MWNLTCVTWENLEENFFSSGFYRMIYSNIFSFIKNGRRRLEIGIILLPKNFNDLRDSQSWKTQGTKTHVLRWKI